MDVDRDTMLRLLRGELDAGEAARVRAAIDSDARLRAGYDRVERLEGALASSAADSFGPYFSDRVMRKITTAATQRAASLYDALQWVFVRLAAASLLVVIGLGIYNVVDAGSSGVTSSTVEALFGIPSADIDNLYYLQGI